MDVKDALQLAYKLGQRNTPESHGELMKLVADHRPQHPVRRHEIASEQTDEMMSMASRFWTTLFISECQNELNKGYEVRGLKHIPCAGQGCPNCEGGFVYGTRLKKS